MKTSKKLLSFFLAVVMAVTSCSIGFTALASEKNSIWTTANIDAESAFESLNGLADLLPPLLMGIEQVSSPIYAKKAAEMGKTADQLTASEMEEINSSVTFQEVLGALQPLLIGALAGTSKTDFLQWFAAEYPEYADATNNEDGFNYLDDNGDNLSLSFYDIITICHDYKDSSELSDEDKATLTEWYNALIELAKLYPELYNASKAEEAKLEAIASQINGSVIVPPTITDSSVTLTYQDATLIELKAFNFDLGSDAALVNQKIADYNTLLAALDIPVQLNDFADYVYYVMGSANAYIANAVNTYDALVSTKDYYDAINAAGESVTFTATANPFKTADTNFNITTDITPDNFQDVLIQGALTAAGVSSCAEYLTYTGLDYDALIAAKQDELANAQAYYNAVKDVFDNEYTPALTNLIKAYYTEGGGNYDNGTLPKPIAKGWNAANKYFGTSKNAQGVNSANAYITNGNAYTCKGGQIGTLNNGSTTITYTKTTGTVTETLTYSNMFKVMYNTPAYPAENSFKPVSAYQTELDQLIAEKNASSVSVDEDYARSYMEKLTFQFYYDIITEGDLANSSYLPAIATGLTITNSDSYSSKADIEADALSLMPAGSTDCSAIGTDDLSAFAEQILDNWGHIPEAYWFGSTVENDDNGNMFKMPESLIGTAVAEYFSLVYNSSRMLEIKNAFETDLDAVNALYAEAYDYAFYLVVKDALEEAGDVSLSFKTSTTTGVASALDVSPFVSAMQAKEAADAGIQTSDVVLTDEQMNVLCATGDCLGYYDFTDAGETKVGTIIINTALNDTIVSLLSQQIDILPGGSIEGLVNNMVATDINLVDILEDVWMHVVDSPIETIVNFIPLLVVLVDELLIPFLANQEYGDGTHDKMYGILESLIPGLNVEVISQLFTANGSYIGIDQIGWNLNTLLPQIMHWLTGQEDTSITFYDGSTVAVNGMNDDDSWSEKIYDAIDVDLIDFDHYAVYDTMGNELTFNGSFLFNGQSFDDAESFAAANPDSKFVCYMTYESDVPHLTGVYIADKALRDAKAADAWKLLVDAVGEDAAHIIGDVINEVALLFTAALDEYQASPYSEYSKYNKNGEIMGKGLNDIFVALPILFDMMENLAAEKYGIDTDAWTYCYDGKFVAGQYDNQYANIHVQGVKDLAANPSSAEILDWFAELLVENWLNAILSLLNNAITPGNDISDNLPVVAGLLNALGGFGEKSIFTDIINSVFQINRSDDYSFTFSTENTNPNNNLNGLTKDNAYFLLSNIDRLIEVIQNLIAHFGGSDDSDTPNDGGDDTPSAPAPAPTITAADPAKATSKNYSTSDLSNTKSLISNLDKLLASLLSDSTLNDYSLNSTENLLAGIVSLLDRFLGQDVNLSDKTTTDIVKLVNQYLYFVTGESANLTAKDNDVDAKKVYSNNALTGLVVETYALVEKIADELLAGFTDTYDDNPNLKYNLLTEAIDGVIAPDAISVRLDDYPDAQAKFAEGTYTTWTAMSEASSRHNYSNLKVDWGFTDGDKDAFYDGFAASLRLVTSILGVLLIDTGWYETVVTPVLGSILEKNGLTLTPYADLVADKEATGYYDATLIAILQGGSDLINALLASPAKTLIQTIQALAGIIDDNNTACGTVTSIIQGVIKPIKVELGGLASIFEIPASFNPDGTSPALADLLNGLANDFALDISSVSISDNGLSVDGIAITGENLIPIINNALKNTGITLKQISWSKIYSSTPEAALVYVLDYVLETLIDNKVISDLIGGLDGTIAEILNLLKVNQLTAADILGILNQILEASDSPTLAYWTFIQYLQQMATGFTYPLGITSQMANKSVDDLDNLVANIFPLLSSFGLDLGGNDLKGVLDAKLLTNENLTKLTVALYGALDGLDPTIKGVLNSLGIVTSTKDVAKLLTDSSFGATYSSAASAISAQSSWSKIDAKKVNWGFTDGSSKAQQGFVNGLAAVLRPLYTVLNFFLAEGTLQLDEVAYGALMNLNVPASSTTLDVAGNIVIKITYSMKNGVLTLSFDDAIRERSTASQLKIDFKSIKEINDLKLEGTNGYNSAIIPLLEALQCGGIKNYSQYKSDVKSAKDNLLLDVLNPIAGDNSNSLLNKLVAAPFNFLTQLLPNLAMYLDAHGVVQLVCNLLAPITDVLDLTGAGSETVNDIIKALLGNDLADAIIPLVNKLLASKGIAITLPNINWNALISLGTKSTYTSAATGADGKYLIGKMITSVDKGKVLISVLRYLATVLVNNASGIKNLLLGIDAIKKSDVLTAVIASIFNTIGTSTPDQIVVALITLLNNEPTNAFWNYSQYKTGEYEFAYPENIDVDFLKNLAPMLDGLIGGLIDLNGLITEKVFTDEIITKLATGLYGAIEGVKVGDGSLTALLAQTDIDFSTANVAKLLVDKDYGQTYESAAAIIRSAGSWKNVNADALKWGVTDRDSFFHALVAVLRPIYGVLDVLLNDGDLNLFNLIRIPGSNGYTATLVPLMEALSMYNIKTQYQYRQDIHEEYDAILLDVINPIWDWVEDLLAAPLQTLMAVLPNLALFIGNNGLPQILDNLLTPVSALLDTIRPIVDLNTLLPALLSALHVDLNGLLAKVGIKNLNLDLYDINATLKPVLGADALIPLVNNILGLIDIKGTKLGLKLNDVDWLQLASHGTTYAAASQAASYGARIYVVGDPSETLIAVLRYLIDTINSGDNFQMISDLIAGLLGDGVSDSISDVISQVMGMLQGDTDEVIASLVDLLQTLA